MKLGTQTGSLVNHILSNTIDSNPQVGMGATEFLWTDRRPWRVVEVVKENKEVKIAYINAVRIDKNGMSEEQEYDYSNHSDHTITLVRRGNSWRTWNELHQQWCKMNIKFGYAEQYYDFSF
jgi:hypothetical protein